MASAMGAGSGADMLQEVLRRKLVEQAQLAQQQQFAAKLAEDARQANMGNDIQQGNLALGRRRVDEDVRQFNENAPVRIASVGHLNAETGELQRRPQAEKDQRLFASGEAEKGRTFQGGQGDLNRQNAVRIANIQGQNALRVAENNHPGTGQTAQQANEVQDTINLIDQISKDPSLSHAVGPVDQYVGGVINADPTGVNRFRALQDQLTGKMSLAQAGKLKGQGQISDKERAMLAAAATALRPGMGEKDYLAELAKIRGQFERMANHAAMGGGNMQGGGHVSQEFDYVPGKGLVPRGGK